MHKFHCLAHLNKRKQKESPLTKQLTSVGEQIHEE